MEGISLFVSIVIIVFGVLQIILFFKLWGMTNDVKKIKQALPNASTNISPAKMEFIIGNTDKAKEMMQKEFIFDIYLVYQKAARGYITKREYIAFFNELGKKYRTRFGKYSEFIEFGQYSTFDKAKEVFG